MQSLTHAVHLGLFPQGNFFIPPGVCLPRGYTLLVPPGEPFLFPQGNFFVPSGELFLYGHTLLPPGEPFCSLRGTFSAQAHLAYSPRGTFFVPPGVFVFVLILVFGIPLHAARKAMAAAACRCPSLSLTRERTDGLFPPVYPFPTLRPACAVIVRVSQRLLLPVSAEKQNNNQKKKKRRR